MVTPEGLLTVTEFEGIAAQDDDRRLELIHGEIVEKMPTQVHAYIVALLTASLINFLTENPLGKVLVEARYRVPGDEHNSVIPDLSFVSNDKGKLVSEGAAPYMPDLAAEVQSPGQSDKFLADKAAYYLANGSRMVWLVYPSKKLVEVLTTDDRQLLIVGDTINGGEVLPGFTLELAALFKDV